MLGDVIGSIMDFLPWGLIRRVKFASFGAYLFFDLKLFQREVEIILP